MTKSSRTVAECNAVSSLLDQFLLSPPGVAKVRIDRAKYGCKTCGRRFESFQALGGHCTTHNRARPGGKRPPLQRRRRAHGCAVCGVEFGTGQALGGHMRRHRPLSSPRGRRDCGEEKTLWLDLNSPPPEDEPEVVDFLGLIGR